MGFFSNLFKKKENTQPASAINITVKTGIVTNDPDIPPLQGDYAKAVFLWAHSKASPIKDNDSYARYFLYLVLFCGCLLIERRSCGRTFHGVII